MKIIQFKNFEKNTLRGFLEVELPTGLRIRDLTLHDKNGSLWIGYPSRPYTDKDGNTKYSNTLYFEDRETNARFQREILAALKAYQPADDKGGVPF